MKTIGLLLNKIHDQTAPLVGQVIKTIIKRPDLGICIFANKTMNLSDVNACVMSMGTIVNFTGDMICFNSDDALLCLQSNRDINIKYYLHQKTVVDIVQILPYHKRIEFLVYDEEYKRYTHMLIKDNLKTMEEYLDATR